MSAYCKHINGICKYCNEDDGCIFDSQGSGEEEDMPCYKPFDYKRFFDDFFKEESE